MKAISLWQPWAVLCALGAKQFETRDWGTNYRGPLLIHAATNHSREVIAGIYRLASALVPYGLHGVTDLSFGCVIGRVELVGCHQIGKGFRAPSDAEEKLGNWSAGRYAWELKHPRVFNVPIPFPGRQRLFRVADELLPGCAFCFPMEERL